jgi:hypothetical protein
MSDTPIGDAIKDIPKNQLDIEVSDSQQGGPTGRISIEREKGNFAGGAFGEVSKDKGWSTGAFIKWMFGR